MKKIVLSCLLICSMISMAQAAKTTPAKIDTTVSQTEQVKTVPVDNGTKSSIFAGKKSHTLEISFGNGLIFLDQGMRTSSTSVEKRTLPVTSHLFLFEIRFLENLELAAAWILPQETVKRVSGTTVTEKYVAPAFGFGPVYVPFTIHIADVANIEPQFGVFCFRTYNSASEDGNFFYPTGFFRVHISTMSKTGVYLGVAQSPAKNTTTFIFGIGQRF